MMIRFSCPFCSSKFKVSDSKAGKAARCPNCDERITIPATDADTSKARKRQRSAPEQTPPEDADGDVRKLSSVRFAVCLAWLPAGYFIALSSVGLHLLPDPIASAVAMTPVAFTCLLIAWNLSEALQILWRTGRAIAALPLTLVQLALFSLLFFQVYHHLGAENYTIDAQPGLWAWLQFAMAHATRATDLIDGLESFGINLQQIHPGSHLTSVMLMAFHLVMNVFVLRWLFEYIGEWTGKLRIDSVLVKSILIVTSVLLFAFWLIWATLIDEWRMADLFLWPIANALRVVDFIDYMEVYRIRIDDVPREGINGWITLMCRLAMALLASSILANWWRGLCIERFDGRGLDRAELQSVVDADPESAQARTARHRLQMLESGQTDRLKVGMPPVSTLFTTGIAATVLILASQLFTKSIPQVASLAVTGSQQDSSRAHNALRLAGPGAADAVPIFEEAWSKANQSGRLAIVRTLGEIGEPARPLLKRAFRESVSSSNRDLQIACVGSLKKVGDSGIEMLVEAVVSQDAEIRSVARDALEEFGEESLPVMLEQLDRRNGGILVTVLQRIDPYWARSVGPNSDAAYLAPHVDVMRTLYDPDSDELDCEESLQKILARGEGNWVLVLNQHSVLPVPAYEALLKNLMADDIASSRLADVGELANDFLRDVLDSENEVARMWAAEMILGNATLDQQLLRKQEDVAVAAILEQLDKELDARERLGFVRRLMRYGDVGATGFLEKLPFDYGDQSIEMILLQDEAGIEFLAEAGQRILPWVKGTAQRTVRLSKSDAVAAANQLHRRFDPTWKSEEEIALERQLRDQVMSIALASIEASTVVASASQVPEPSPPQEETLDLPIRYTISEEFDDKNYEVILISSKAGLAVLTTEETNLYLWRYESEQQPVVLGKLDQGFADIKLSNDGSLLATIDEGGALKVWTTADAAVVYENRDAGRAEEESPNDDKHLTISNDNQFLAVSYRDRVRTERGDSWLVHHYLNVFDVREKDRVASAEFPQNVLEIDFHPTRNELAILEKKSITILSVPDAETILKFPIPDGPKSMLVHSTHGNLIATCTRSADSLLVWNRDDGELLTYFRVPKDPYSHRASIRDLRFTNDDSALMGVHKGQLYIWSLNHGSNGERVGTYRRSPLTAYSTHQNGNVVVTGHSNNVVLNELDVSWGASIRQQLPGDLRDFKRITYNERVINRPLVPPKIDENPKDGSLPTGRFMHMDADNPSEETTTWPGIKASHSSGLCVVAMEDGTMITFDSIRQKKLSEKKIADGRALLIDIDSSGEFGVALAADGLIHVWKLKTGETIRQIEYDEDERSFYASLRLSPKGKYVFYKRQIRGGSEWSLVDVDSGESLKSKLPEFTDPKGAFSRDGRTLIVADRERLVGISLESFKPKFEYNDRAFGSAFQVDATNDASTVVLVGSTQINIVRTSDGKVMHSLNAGMRLEYTREHRFWYKQYPVNCFAFAPEENVIAFAMKDQRVWLWKYAESETAVEIGSMPVDSESRYNFCSMEFSEDRKRVIVFSNLAFDVIPMP